MKALLLLVVACGGPLPEAFIVNDLRVIGMASEPAQVRQGEPVRVTAYMFDPDSDARTVRVQFYMCEDSECLFTGAPADIYFEGEAARVGVDLYAASFEWTPPANFLADKGTLAQRYGFDQEILVRADNGLRFIDALKRVTVKPTESVLNKNPALTAIALTLNGILIGDDRSNDTIVRGTAYVMTPVVDPLSVETYQVVEFTGGLRELTEEMSFTWTCSPTCTISQRVSYAGDLVTVTTPETGAESGRFTVQLVMRDGRGGESVRVKTFALLPQTRVF